MEPTDASKPTLLDQLRVRSLKKRVFILAALLPVAVVGAALLIQPAALPSSSRDQPARPAAVRPDAGDLLATIAFTLPPDAFLRSVDLDAAGRLSLEVDAMDPEKLRSALAKMAPLVVLRTESEAAVPDRGYRVRLIGSVLGDAPSPVVTRLAGHLRGEALAAGLLVETVEQQPEGVRLAVSGPEQNLLRFASKLRLAGWRLAADRAALRLTGVVVATGQAASLPTRPLFASDDKAASPAGMPELAGIVGRLPDAAVALVRTPDGRVRSVSVGQAVDDWTLIALSADAALFTHGNERLRVTVSGGEDAPQ